MANAAGVSKGVRIREALDKGTAEAFTLIGKGSIHFHKKHMNRFLNKIWGRLIINTILLHRISYT